jgi:hypothetical protein
LLGVVVVAAAGFTAALVFATVCFLCAFFTVVVAGAVEVCAFGAVVVDANIAAADNRVMLISFFILVSPLFVADLFVRPQSYFAWKLVSAPSRRSGILG